MPTWSATKANVRQLLVEFLRQARSTASLAKDQVLRPSKLEAAADGATRTGQVVAVLFLPFLIVVSLTIITVINNLMAGVLGAGTIEGEQLSIVAFLITAITLGCLMIVAWGWFQWVRTAGFGAFS